MASPPANDAPYRLINDVEFGAGVVVFSFTNLYGCKIGDKTRVGPFVEIQRGVVVGSNCKIQSHTCICLGVEIGDDVFVGHVSLFIDDNFPSARTWSFALESASDWRLLQTHEQRDTRR